MDDNHGGAAVGEDGADLEVVLVILHVQVVQDVLQVADGVVISGSGITVVGLDEHGLDVVLVDIEAFLVGGINIQGAALQAGSLGHGLVVAPDLLIQDGGVVLSGVLHVVDVIHEVLAVAAIVQGQGRIAGRSSAGVLTGLGVVGVLDALHGAVGLEVDLIPGVLAHAVDTVGPVSVVALLSQQGLHAVLDDLAGPGPLVVGLLVPLALDGALVGVHQVLGGTVVLAQHDGGDHIAVLVVQGVDVAGQDVIHLAGAIRIKAQLAVVLRLNLGQGPGAQVHVVNTNGHAAHAGDDADVVLDLDAISLIRSLLVHAAIGGHSIIVLRHIYTVLSQLSIRSHSRQLGHDIHGVVVAVHTAIAGAARETCLWSMVLSM